MQHCLRWITATILFTLVAFRLCGQVTASFTASPAAGCPPLLVHFTNTTTPASGTTYSWNMDNGSGPDTATNPSTSYLLPGIYTVTLTATHGGTTSTATRTVTVYPTPAVSFTVSDTAVCPNVPITFASTSSAGVPGTPTYFWSFGDGYTATTSAATHSFSLPGHFNITLSVTNADGCTSSLTQPALIHIFAPPTPVFSVTATHICPGSSVTFAHLPGGTAPVSYRWSFGDGSPSSSSPGPAHIYTAPGSYGVKLVLTDNKGCEDSATIPAYITVANMIAAFTGPDTACIHLPVTFTNTSSSYTSSKWIYGNGRTDTTTNGHAIYDTAGIYTVKLVTYNGYCYDTVAHSIYIPSPVSSFTMTPAHPCPAPEAQTFTVNVPAGGTASWDFGDGTSGAGFPISHTFNTNGFIPITMFVTYSVGCKDTVTQVDSIFNLHFNEGNYSPMGGCIPFTAVFQSSATTSFPPVPPGVPEPLYPYPFHYEWNFGDGSPIDTTPVSASHVYTAVGVFPVTLTAISSNGCVVVMHDSMPAGVPPLDTFDVSPLHECFNVNQIYAYRTRFITHLLRGPITSVYWEFGDATDESDTTTVVTDTFFHSFAYPGFFKVTLTSYFNGCPSVFHGRDTVVIDSPESRANFIFLCNPAHSVKFENGSIGDDTHVWIFGDGATSTLDTIVHTYPSYAMYTAYLITHNNRSGCSDTQRIVLDLTRPIASFTAADTALCRNDTAVFTATVSSGYISDFKWHIDTFWTDSLNTLLRYPAPTPGRYTVQLIFYDQHRCTDTITRTNYLLVAQPVDHFSVSPPGICYPGAATFTDASTDQPGAIKTNYRWRFGDGLTASVSTPAVTHNYTAAGTYTVTEIVTDNVGCRDSLSQSVSVYKPRASFTQSATRVCAYTGVAFTNASTPAGAAYNWTFGDGATSTLASPVHSYADTGHFNVSLVVTDPHGCHDTATGRVQVSKPHAAFKMDDSVATCPPLLVHFTNLSTGGISNIWHLGVDSFSATNPVYTFPSPGLDTLILVVKDSAGCRDTAVGHIKVYGYKGAFSYLPDSGCAPLTVRFDAQLTDSSRGASLVWDFSDGTLVPVTSDTFYHTYTIPGAYQPKLINSSCPLYPSLGKDTIRVDGVLPGFMARPNPVCVGDTMVLADSSVSYWSQITRHLWRHDGITDSVATDSITYTAVGTDSITLQVSSAWGCSATVTKAVTVNPLPNAGFITSNLVNAFCIGDKFEVHDTVSGGSWSIANGHASLSGDTITALSPGTDTVFYTVSNSCGAAAAMDIFNVAQPVPPVSGNKAVCVGDTTILSDSMSAGMWRGGSVHAIVFSNMQDSGIVVGVSAGTATITYQMDLGCSTTATVTIDPLPDVTSTVSPIKCFGDSNAVIAITPRDSTAPFTYRWTNGAVTSVISSLSPGTYAVTIKDTALGCRLAETFQVTMPDSLSIIDSISNDVCFSPNGSISITASGGTTPYGYEWSNKSTGNEIKGLNAGSYSLILTDFNGCTKNYTFILSDSACLFIEIHNAISPNGDGVNDTWVIERIQNYPRNVVQVFDKWGDEIYERTGYNNDWGGMGKDGKEVPDGTYYYVVKLNSEFVTGEKNVFTGYLMIKR